VPSGDRARYDRLVEEIHREFPRFRIVLKSESAGQRAIHNFLAVITLGGMRHYLDSYHTTLGQTVYVTPSWDNQSWDRRYVTLRHERVHMRQFRRMTWPAMALLYGLLPLPMGLAYFRAQFEKEAYAESIRAGIEVWGLDAVREAKFREGIISQFLGPSYGWMWPFRRSMERWYDSVLEAAPHE
jgi:hypothetical protein